MVNSIFLTVFCLHNCIHIVQLPCVDNSVGNLYLDVCSLLDDLTVANYSNCVPPLVAILDTEISRRSPLTHEMLNSSSLLAPLPITNSRIGMSILRGM